MEAKLLQTAASLRTMFVLVISAGALKIAHPVSGFSELGDTLHPFCFCLYACRLIDPAGGRAFVLVIRIYDVDQ